MLNQKLADTIKSLNSENLSADRKVVLSPLIDYIKTKVSEGNSVRINFICTHNSRRSHLSQIWAQTMAYYFKIDNVCCYSGGTEATAIYTTVVKTLKNVGFEINYLTDNSNAIHAIKYSENEHPILGFSKKHDDDFNPKSDFAAVLTCSQADDACPFIAGAEVRLPIMYEDPKAFDNTAQEIEKYEERSQQIAEEMYYVFSQIK